MLLSLRVSPYLPLRRFFFFLCRSSASSYMPPPPMAGYKEAFARRMAMAGITPHHRIALGVSGGPDSTALCILAAGWKLDGSAPKDEASGYIEGLLGIVVDHRLRPESTEEAEIVIRHLQICRGVEQVWVEDPTNQNLSFVRNRIRASLTSLSS